MSPEDVVSTSTPGSTGSATGMATGVIGGGGGAGALATITGVPSAGCPIGWIPAPLSATGGGGTMTGGSVGSGLGVAGCWGGVWNGVPSGSKRSSGGVFSVPSGLTSGWAPVAGAGVLPGVAGAGVLPGVCSGPR